MSKAVALLEFESVAVGVLAVDRMLKKAPVALLRCGTIHPGRYLVLVGGTVASTQEAHLEGLATGNASKVLADEVMLADPHPFLVRALQGTREEPHADTVAVLEVSQSPAMLRILDAVLKAVPVQLDEVRLADDLGGRAIALLSGDLTDVQEAVTLAGSRTGPKGEVIGAAIMSRLDDTLRAILTEGSHFATCRNWQPEGAESLED